MWRVCDTARNTDKATIGETFKVALAENEDALTELGWESFSVSRGFKSEDSVVTVQSVVYATAPIASGGDKAKDHLDTFVKYLAEPCRPGLIWGLIGENFSAAGNQSKHCARAGERRIEEKGCATVFVRSFQGFRASMERLAWQGGSPASACAEWWKRT